MRPVTRPRLTSGAAALLLVATAALVVGPTIGPANAAPVKVTISSGPTVAGDDVSLGYSINRQPKAVATRTCTLDTASTSTTVGCGSLPTRKASPAVVSLTLSDVADGTYTFTVRVTLGDGGRASATSAPFTIDTNAAPSVTAFGRTFIVGDPTGVTGRVTDDGRPDPPAAVTTTWSVVSGPGAVVFEDEHAVTTPATFAELGLYVLRLTASDGARTAHADAVVQVLPDLYPDARIACRAEPLSGFFDQGPLPFSDLWECTWDAPAQDDPASVAKADQLAFLCRSTYDGDPSTKLLSSTGKVFCNARPA